MDNPISKPTEEDFQNAFLEEMTDKPAEDKPADPVTPPVDDKPVEDVTPPVDDKPVEDKPADESTEEEKKAAEEKEAELAKDETPEQTEERHKKETEEAKVAAEAKAAADAKAKEFATKDDVKAAMREYQTETAAEVKARVEKLDTAKKQVIEKLHPEGIDQKIYDTNGNVIKTAQDIVDRGLVNERTGEPYSYEEAASFMLEAGKKMAENMKELEDWAEGIAEKNVDLLEGNDRVLAQWGDVLKALPEEMVEKIANDYISTQVKFDKTNSYVTEMNMTPEAFYTTVLAPYTELRKSISSKSEADEKAAAEAAATAAKEKEEAELAEQAERNGGIPPQRGVTAQKANTGDPMLDALMDEMNKKD